MFVKEILLKLKSHIDTHDGGSGRLQYPTLSNRQTIQTQTKQKSAEVSKCYKPNGPYRCL